MGDHTNSVIDRTATAFEGYRGGWALVRIGLPAKEFEPWSAIEAREPRLPWWASGPDVHCLADAAREMDEGSEISRWLGRDKPLSLERAVSIEAREYAGLWQPVAPEVKRNGEALGVVIGRRVYFSEQIIEQGAPTIYRGYVVEAAT